MASKIYGAIALTGGASGALDAISGADLIDLDMAFVVVGGIHYIYYLDADSAAAESSPYIIAPDTDGGDKRWILSTPIGHHSITAVPAIVANASQIWCADYVAGDARIYIMGEARTDKTILGSGSIELQALQEDAVGATATFLKNRDGAGQDSDVLGVISFKGYNDAETPELIEYAKIEVVQTDASDGTEDSTLKLYVRTDGTLAEMSLGGGTAAGSDTHVQFNDGGTDFGGDAGLVYNKTTNMLTVDGDVHAKRVVGASEYDNGNSSTSDEIDWANGNHQKSTLTGNCEFTYANADVGRYTLRLIQDGTGSRTVTWPTTKWAGGVAPTLSTAASSIDIISLYYDGETWYGQFALGFATV